MSGETPGSGIVVVNFGHPLTDRQRDQLEAAAGAGIDHLIEVPVVFDHAASFGPQAAAIVDAVGLTSLQWHTARLVVGVPTFHAGAGAVLAELHGRIGHFPPVLRLRPSAGPVPGGFELAEVLDLQGIRDGARNRGVGR